jgi:hypothetical protein
LPLSFATLFLRAKIGEASSPEVKAKGDFSLPAG